MGSEQHPGADAPGEPPRPTVVVGLGASAGGLEALQRFLAQLPARSGVAFVVVQHLDPHHPSLLAELLARFTAMRVAEATDGTRPEPDHVHVAPAGRTLALAHGIFRLTVSADPMARAAPIDAFFRSLAEDRGPRATGVVLSGFGHDGTAGLRAIRDGGGLTLAQDPETAGRDEMPLSAIEAGVVDHVLAPERLAAKVLEHVGYVARAEHSGTAASEAALTEQLPEICELVRRHTGHDFGSYKPGTLLRRIGRRLHVLRVDSPGDYVALLEKDAGEAEALVKDLLIGVTRFFRDPAAFEALAQEVVPRIVQTNQLDVPVRIWVPGCASGEEVYSIGILVREHLDRLGSRRPVQMFATDLDGELLAVARRGRYPAQIAAQLSPERLARFFTRERQAYVVTAELRDACIFSQHSLVRDPPFSQLDLISCRNVLIYLGAELQRKLFPLFHYALRPGGFLFLGPSEGLPAGPELFETVDKQHRMFRRKETVTRPAIDFPLSPPAEARPERPPPAPAPPRIAHAAPVTQTPRQRLAASFERMVLEEYSHPCAVVDGRGEIVLVAGPIARFLHLPAGALTTNLLEVVRGSLRIELRAALGAAARTGKRVVRDGIAVEVEGSARQVRLVVRPMAAPDPGSRAFAVVFEERAPVAESGGGGGAEAAPLEAPAVERLEDEVRSMRAELSATVEALESANEEMKSSNEELQSANEELQTSKAELQSLNEEMETVNAELRHKVEELGTANSDLQNLFASTEIATIFLDRGLAVAKFTPAARDLLHLREADVGRPLGELAPRFAGLDLVADAREVARTLAPIERQVRPVEGDRWFFLRVVPYRTVEGLVAGVVITVVDVTPLKRAENALRDREAQLRLFVEHAPAAVAMLDREMRYVVASRRYLSDYRVPLDDVVGRSHYDVFPELPERWKEVHRRCLAGAVEKSDGDPFPRGDGTVDWVRWEIHPWRTSAGEIGGLILMSEVITERKRVQDALRESEARLRRAQEIAHLGSWELDFERNRLYWSDEVYRIFGLAPQEFGASYEAFLEAAHPDDRAAVDAAYSGSLRDGKDTYEIVHRAVRRSTGEIRVVHEKCEHLRDARGRVVKSVGMVHDVTERRRAEEAVERSRQGLTRLADASLSVMATTNLDGMLQAMSEAALALTGAQLAICGHGLMGGQLVLGGSARAPGAPACPPGSMFRLEKGGVHMVLAEGADAIRLTDEELRAHERWWGLPEAHAPMRGLLGVPLRARSGQPSGMLLVTDKERGDFDAEDESLLRQLGTVGSLALQHVEARIALEGADRHKNEFLAMLSHELRNPLAPIRNSLYILDRAPPGSEQALRAQHVIGRQVSHMTRLVDELLDVTRIARGKIHLQREQLDVVDVVRRAVEDHRPAFAASGVAVEVVLPSDAAWIDGDRTRVAQVMDNLLQNAAKFTPSGGEVTVSVEASDGHVQVRVRDTGVGLAPEMLPRLFEPFMQADTTLDRSKGGLGLGLALVRGLVEMHGGTVSAGSAGLGKGAEFTVRFPSQAGPGSAEPLPAARVRGPPRRVLVIEDSADSAQSLREVLELAGHAVEVASSGPAGIEKARRFAPDVVLCDIGLPGMDGYDVARTIREDPSSRSVRLVALTGYAAPDDVARAREAGFDDHLAKPLGLEQLERVLAEAGRAPT